MFLMNQEKVFDEINKINNYLLKCSWMDFTLNTSHNGIVELFGAIDQTYNNYRDNYEIKIVFEQPFYVSSLFYWQTDTSIPFIQLMPEDELSAFNQKYHTEIGNYVFTINAEHYNSPPIIIAAKKLSCKIINENPFS